MSNIRVDMSLTIFDGAEVTFKSPCDCSAVTGLRVYYPNEFGETLSKDFAFVDAHGNDVTNINELFLENVMVKVVLDCTRGNAFVQNADTNSYIEGQFAAIRKTLPAAIPNEVLFDGANYGPRAESEHIPFNHENHNCFLVTIDSGSPNSEVNVLCTKAGQFIEGFQWGLSSHYTSDAWEHFSRFFKVCIWLSSNKQHSVQVLQSYDENNLEEYRDSPIYRITKILGLM